MQVVSLAGTLGGQAESWAHDHTVAMAGGDDTTNSEKGSVAGDSIGAEVPAVVKVMDVPVTGSMLIYNLPVEVVGQAVTDVQNLYDSEDEDESLTRALPMAV